ncbi:hypothetical protein ABE237_00655 [Brevibacillus formosus]|uniref:hypothetical protein n=1 Tax=Brevibacillus formosus TaxID=54913 RepID=UPI0018CCBF19|nr:hypothetical protein [Brevibacillus formosus]MBG9944660.1 hypothetical protein [Brevibacillus formosus]
MGKHKKPPIRNNARMITVKESELHNAAEEAVEHATWLIEEALKEEFGFGESRLQRLREKVDELARHKSFNDYVDHVTMTKMRA